MIKTETAIGTLPMAKKKDLQMAISSVLKLTAPRIFLKILRELVLKKRAPGGKPSICSEAMIFKQSL